MAQHTPGPWTQLGRLIYAGGERGANICAISEPRATTTVEYTELRLGSPDADEAWANARLIAAAPALHTVVSHPVLEWLVTDGLEHIPEPQRSSVLLFLVPLRDAALMQATGLSQRD